MVASAFEGTGLSRVLRQPRNRAARGGVGATANQRLALKPALEVRLRRRDTDHLDPSPIGGRWGRAAVLGYLAGVARFIPAVRSSICTSETPSRITQISWAPSRCPAQNTTTAAAASSAAFHAVELLPLVVQTSTASRCRFVPNAAATRASPPRPERQSPDRSREMLGRAQARLGRSTGYEVCPSGAHPRLNSASSSLSSSGSRSRSRSRRSARCVNGRSCMRRPRSSSRRTDSSRSESRRSLALAHHPRWA